MTPRTVLAVVTAVVVLTSCARTTTSTDALATTTLQATTTSANAAVSTTTTMQVEQPAATDTLPTTTVQATTISANAAVSTTTVPGSTTTTTQVSTTTIAVSTTTITSPVEDEAGGIEGLEVLYIGHSFGRPFAANLESVTGLAGIDGHEQHIIFKGGEGGAPQAMWEAPEQQALIKERLDTGTVDVVVMICCSQEFKDSAGQSDQAIFDISAYALEQNPETQIGLAMPWLDFPSSYASVDDHRAVIDAVWPLYQQLAERVSSELGAEVFAFYHGAAVFGVRALFEQGLLSDVTNLIGPRTDSVFTDEKGHAGTLAKDAGTLVWLHAIYGVDPLDLPPFNSYDVDIREIASAALDHALA